MKTSDYAIRVNGSETELEAVLEVELSAVKKEDVSLEILGNVVHVRAIRKDTYVPQGEVYSSVEHAYGAVERWVSIPFPVDREKTIAKFENGILLIRIPKTEESLRKKVKIT